MLLSFVRTHVPCAPPCCAAARLAALLDGVDPPENMRRCFADNCDIEVCELHPALVWFLLTRCPWPAQGFWRGWHSSFNLWLVRYLYVPLGGASARLRNTCVAFSFVALWHDLEVRRPQAAALPQSRLRATLLTV